MAQASYRHSVRRAAFSRGIVLPEAVTEQENNQETTINLVIRPSISREIKTQLLKAVDDIKFANLGINIINPDHAIDCKNILKSFPLPLL